MLPAYAMPMPMMAPMMPVGPTAPFGMRMIPGIAGPVYLPTVGPGSQQMLAQALGYGTVGQQMLQPQTTSPLKSMLKGGAVGALAGAAFGALPVLPPGLFLGGIIGAVAGAAIGLVSGLKKRKQEQEFHTMQVQSQANQAAAAVVANASSGAAGVPKP